MAVGFLPIFIVILSTLNRTIQRPLTVCSTCPIKLVLIMSILGWIGKHPASHSNYWCYPVINLLLKFFTQGCNFLEMPRKETPSGPTVLETNNSSSIVFQFHPRIDQEELIQLQTLKPLFPEVLRGCDALDRDLLNGIF